jgi:hypothetical protein
MGSIGEQTRRGETPLLVQAGRDRPVFRGIGTGRNHRCVDCNSLLMENVTDASVFDLRIQCGSCGRIAEAPSAPPGRGLGGILRVVARDHRFVGTFVLDMDEVVVGEGAMHRRQGETGQRPGQESPQAMLDIAGIERIVQDARSTFAPILDVALPASRRQIARRHRLVRLIDAVERNLQALGQGGVEVDVRSIIMLQRGINGFRSWQDDPGMPRLIEESKQSEAFEHNSVLLQVATVFEHARLGAELLPPGQTRTADLALRVSATHRIEIDTKTPQALQLPAAGFFRLIPARTTVKSALRRSRGQFATSGILVIAGEAWPHGIDSYATATEQLLSAPLAADAGGEARLHYQRLLGLLFVSTGYEEIADREFRARLYLRWIANPRYTGPLDLQLHREFDGPFSLRIQSGITVDTGVPVADDADETAPFASEGASDPARFRLLADGEIEVDGTIANATAPPARGGGRTAVWQFGEGYRPPADREFDVACQGGFTVVTVCRDGRLLADPTHGWINLHGVRYAAA